MLLTSVNSVNYIKTKAQYVTRERQRDRQRDSERQRGTERLRQRMGTVW